MGNEQSSTPPTPPPVTKEEPHKMLRVGKFQKAIKLYSEELELAQDDLERASLLSNRAYAYLMAKKFKEAAEDATLSLQLKPAYKKSQARLAMAEAVLTQQSEQYSQAADAEGGDDVSLPDITEAQLANFNGTNEMPIYIAVRDVVYDMTDNGGWGFYSPGNAYEVFAGKDATVGLAKMTLKPEECQTNERGLKGEESVVDLNDEDFEVLVDWVKKYDEKYKVVGNLLWDHTVFLEQQRSKSGNTSGQKNLGMIANLRVAHGPQKHPPIRFLVTSTFKRQQNK